MLVHELLDTESQFDHFLNVELFLYPESVALQLHWKPSNSSNLEGEKILFLFCYFILYTSVVTFPPFSLCGAGQPLVHHSFLHCFYS